MYEHNMNMIKYLIVMVEWFSNDKNDHCVVDTCVIACLCLQL